MTEASDTSTAGGESVIQGLPPALARAIELSFERKGSEVMALDLRGISSATDFFLLVSGNSDIQVRAIAEHVLDQLRQEGIRPNHVEGLDGGRWVLLDFVDWVMHVFHPTARDFYQLERLWGDAPVQAFHDV
jgi:ribosome-associated protein